MKDVTANTTSGMEINMPTDAEQTVGRIQADSFVVESNGKLVVITTEAVRKGLAQADDTYQWLINKLIRHFKYTPYMTRGHIQMSLGPATPPRVWEGTLKRMMDDNRMVCQTTISNFRTKRVYHTPDMPWPPISLKHLDRLKKEAWMKGYTAGIAGEEIPEEVSTTLNTADVIELDANGDQISIVGAGKND